MDQYLYLDANYEYVNGKKKLINFDLCDRGELLYSYSIEQSKEIMREIRENKVKVKHVRSETFIDDEIFIRHVLRTMNPPQRKKTNKKFLAAAIIGLSVLSIAGIKKIKNNTNTTSISIVAEASELEEDKTENITENTTESKTENITEQVSLDDTTAPMFYEDTTTTENNTIVDNGFEDIFQFAYKDRSDSENINIVNNNYSDLIDKYSNMYGVDSKLMAAIISQENPTNIKNYELYAGHGVPQIEAIWQGSDVVAYNFNTNQNESSGPIDVIKCVDDQDYSIKLSCMIINNYYNSIHEQYGYKLTKEQELTSTVWAYNKGITIINEALSNTNSYNEFIEYVKERSIGGDNEYIEHVFSYIQDEDIVSMKTRDGLLNSVMIDNVTVDNKKPRTI